jgi:outer membrane protein W
MAFRATIIAILFISNIISTYSQDSCANTLAKAQELYDAGVIEQIPELLAPCLSKGFSKDESIKAYKLIITSYLFNENNQEADNTMLQFLKQNPDYEVTANDQAEFIQLFKSFKKIPVTYMGVIAGSNITNGYITELYGPFNLNGNKPKYKTNGIGYQAGVSFSQYMFNNLYINLDVLYIHNAYEYNYSGEYVVSFIEKQNRVELPLTFTYVFLNTNKISPYIRAGASASYLLSATGKATRSFTVSGPEPISSPIYTITDNREPYAFWGLAGAGVQYKYKMDLFFLDIRYSMGFTNQVNAKNRYTNNSELLSIYYYQDSGFTLSNLSFSVGYMYTFYKTKKKH